MWYKIEINYSKIKNHAKFRVKVECFQIDTSNKSRRKAIKKITSLLITIEAKLNMAVSISQIKYEN